MRDMEFDLDIIFADREGAITEIVMRLSSPAKDVSIELTEYEGSICSVEVRGFCVQRGIESDGYILEVLYTTDEISAP